MSKNAKQSVEKIITIKSFIIIAILSVITTILSSLIAFVFGNYIYAEGFPFKWSSFNFLGSNTDYVALLLDHVFWFIVIFIVWKILLKILKK